MSLFGEARVKVNISSLHKFKQALRNIEDSPELTKAFETWRNIFRAYLRQRFYKFSRGGGDWKPLSPVTLAARRGGRGKKKKRPKARRPVKRKTTKRVTSFKTKVKRVARKARKAIKPKNISSAFRKNKKRIGRIAKRLTKKKRTSSSPAILRDMGMMFAAFNPEIVKLIGILVEHDKIGLRVAFTLDEGEHENAKMSLADLMEVHHYGRGRRLPARKLIVSPDGATANRMAKVMEKGMGADLARRKRMK